jgi:hypothetical protein
MKTNTGNNASTLLALNGFISVDEMVEAAINGNLSEQAEYACLKKFSADNEVIKAFGPMTTRVVPAQHEDLFVLDDQFNDGSPSFETQISIKRVIEMTLNRLTEPIRVSIDLRKNSATVQFKNQSELHEGKQLVEEYLHKFFPIKTLLCEVAVLNIAA